MEYFIITIVTAVISFSIGMFCGKFSIISKMLDTLSEKELAELDALISAAESKIDNVTKPIVLKQEMVGDQVYLYDSVGNFVCQGTSASNAAENYAKSNKAATARVVCSEGKEYTIVDGKVVSELQRIAS